MSTTKPTEDAVAFYLSSHGMTGIDTIKLHDMQKQASVKFFVDHTQAAQMLCHSGRFDLARDLRSNASEIVMRLDVSGTSEIVEMRANDDAEFHPDLADQLLEVYLKKYESPLRYVGNVLAAAVRACEGPPETTVWDFTTAGGLNIQVKASYDDQACYLENYYESGDPECDWQDMVYALDNPSFVVFTIDCVISDRRRKVIGRSALGSCSATFEDEQDFRSQVIKEYRSELVLLAMDEARLAQPKTEKKQASQTRREPQCHTIQA